MPNYMHIIHHYYPKNPANCHGDETNYNDISFIGEAVCKADLDAKAKVPVGKTVTELKEDLVEAKTIAQVKEIVLELIK